MPYYRSQTNGEFSAGIDHQVNPGRSNLGSITLSGSSEQSAVGPHAVLSTTVGGSQDDGTWERYQRDAGGYAPGSVESMTDQISQGSDSTP